jgi:SNF2 family DNA or RNA helicase
MTSSVSNVLQNIKIFSQKLLHAINAQQGRVLLFAISTKALDLIENYILSMGKYSYLRMDGQTTTAKREEIAKEFRASNTFVFLLSTKAMGLGLNLTQVGLGCYPFYEKNPG